MGGGGDEGLDFGERVLGDDVDGLEAWWWRPVVRVESGEKEDEKDEAVFAAVVGDGELGVSV